MTRALGRWLTAAALWCWSVIAGAHDFVIVRAAVVVDGRTVSVTLLVEQGDLLTGLGERRLAFADLAEVDAYAPRLREYLERGVIVEADGARVAVAYLACEPGVADRSAKPAPQLNLVLRGELPADAGRVELALELLAEHDAPLLATVHLHAGAARTVRTVGRGERVGLALGGAPAAGASQPPAPAAAATSDRPWWDWLRLGIRHIVPEGLDHILFVLGLYLLSPRPRAVLLQVTTFTVAHSLTLALALTGTWSLPGELIEPVIALSIAFVAIENLVVRELQPWRVAVVFAFGLIHGLGFAGALAAYTPEEGVVVPLVLMNLGVEIGQLVVVAAAALLTAWWAGSRWYRRAVVIPATLAIAAAGLWWTVERTPALIAWLGSTSG